MNSAELTTLLNEDCAAQRTARMMANIARRASRLFEVGYTATETMNGLYVRCFQVVSPEGKRYSVKIDKTNSFPVGAPFGSKCSCPCFAEHTTCKHLQGVELMLNEEAQEAQCNSYDTLHAFDDFAAAA